MGGLRESRPIEDQFTKPGLIHPGSLFLTPALRPRSSGVSRRLRLDLSRLLWRTLTGACARKAMQSHLPEIPIIQVMPIAHDVPPARVLAAAAMKAVARTEVVFET